MKKFLSVICLTLALISVLCSCAKKDPKETETEDSEALLSNVIFPDEQFYIHRYGTATENDPKIPEEDAEQEISLMYFYMGEKPKISLIGFDAPKADEACIGAEQEFTDMPMHRGYRSARLVLKFDFSRLEYGETVAVNTITLSVGGTEQHVDTTGRLFLTRLTKEEEEATILHESDPAATALPLKSTVLYYGDNEGMVTGLQGIVDKSFTYKIVQDMSLENVEICDWYQIAEATICVERERTDGRNNDVVAYGSMEELGPLTLSKGDLLAISVKLKPEYGHYGSAYETKLRMHYKIKQDGETEVMSHSLRSWAGGTDTAVMWLDTYLFPSKDACDNTVFLEEYVYQDAILEDNANYGYWSDGTPTEQKVEIRMDFLYQERIPYIRFEGINGMQPGIGDTISVWQYSNFVESQGYQVGSLYLGFDLSGLEPGKTLEVETICLSINGFEKTLDMGKRLVYHKSENGNVTPVVNLDTAYGIKGLTIFKLRANEQIVIRKLDLLGPFTFDNLRINVDKETVGTSDRVFPLTLEPDQTLEIVADLSYEKREMYIRYYFDTLVYADVYEKEETGETKLQDRVFKYAMNIGRFDPSTQQKSDLETFIDYILRRKKEEA